MEVSHNSTRKWEFRVGSGETLWSLPGLPSLTSECWFWFWVIELPGSLSLDKGWTKKMVSKAGTWAPGSSHPLYCLSSKSEMNTRVTSDSHWRCRCGAGGPAVQQGWVLIRRLDSVWQARFCLSKAKALNSTFACFWSFCNYSKSWWRGLLKKKK